MQPQLLRIGDDIVAFHAIVTQDGVTLIDAGLPGDMPATEQALASVGKSLADIRGVVLTHGDSDHIGIAEQLRAQFGVPTYVHEADAERAMGRGKGTGKAGKFRLRAAVRFFAVALRRGGAQTQHLASVVTFREGETLALPGVPHVIAVPGHSPGSVAISVPVLGALFLGDAVTTRNVMTGAAGVASAPFTDDPHEAMRSLRALAGQEAKHLYPGHGPEFVGTIDDMLAQLAS